MRSRLRVTILILGTFWGGQAASAFPRLSAELFTNLIGSWTSDQRLVVRTAANKAAQRMFEERILTCAKRFAAKDLPKDMFWSHVNRIKKEAVRVDVQIRQLGQQCPQYGPVVTGRAPVNRFIDQAAPSGGRHVKFSIQLNENCIGNNSLRYSARNSDFWAGVIAHEIGHNLGLIHTSGYGGSFIREWEKCIEHQGNWSGSKSNPGFIDGNTPQEIY